MAHLHSVLADLIAAFAAESHWDLLGELLVCWDCLQLTQDQLYTSAWDLLLSQQAEDGSFPGPPVKGAKRDLDDGAIRFGHCYHTTLVVAIALHCRARRGARVRGAGTQPAGTLGRIRKTMSDAGRHAQWLRGLLDSPGASAPSVAAGVLVGTSLCASLDPELAPSVPVVAERVVDLLAGAEQLSAAPPALLLTAHDLLLRTGHVLPGLERFVEQARAALADHPPLSAAADLALCEKRVLLHRFGLAGAPLQLSSAHARATVDALILQPTSEQVMCAALAVESWCGHGTVKVTGGHAAAKVLERCAVQQFRSGELATGCALVRASNHLCPMADDRAEEFAAHLALHQRPDGGYGHPLGTRLDAAAVELDLSLHLPITLTCLWTLAELRSDFRLYLAIGAPALTEVAGSIRT